MKGGVGLQAAHSDPQALFSIFR